MPEIRHKPLAFQVKSYLTVFYCQINKETSNMNVIIKLKSAVTVPANVVDITVLTAFTAQFGGHANVSNDELTFGLKWTRIKA
jgi:hypothetical protein